MRALWAALHTDGVRRPHAGRSDRRSRHTEAAAPGQAPPAPAEPPRAGAPAGAFPLGAEARAGAPRRLSVARGQTPGAPGRTRPASPRLLGSPPPWTPCTQFLEARPASGGDDRVRGAPG